jgi:MFS family permease
LANRQFALLWSGQTVSQFGDGIVAVALPLLVLHTTGSAADLGLVVAARLLPTIAFLLIGGALTDRVSRRLAMLTSDGARALIAGALGALALAGTLNFAELIVGALLFGTFDALFFPASSAMYPEVLAPEELVRANSLRQSSATIAGQLLGPVVGGLIVATVGTSWSLLIDAGTFVVSAGCLAVMRPTPRPTHTGASMVHQIAEGIRFCRQTSWILWTLVVAGFMVALVYAPIEVLIPLLFTKTLHTSSVGLGIGFAAFGLGGLVGALTLAVVPTPRHRVRTMWTCWIVATFIAVLYGLSPTVWVACVALFMMGPLLMGGQIIWESLLQAEVPREMLGRVSSVDYMVSFSLAPVGVAVAGVVAGAVGIRVAIVVPAIACALASLAVLILVRSMTALDRERLSADQSPA